MSHKKTLIVGFSLFGLVLLTALSTFYVSVGKCPGDSLSCDGGKTCVSRKLVCNFEVDCQDREDENPYKCGKFYGSNEVINADKLEGIEVEKKLNETFNYTIPENFNYHCVIDPAKIPKNCVCRRANMIACSKKLHLPHNIPNDVRMIVLYNNKIKLRREDNYAFASFPGLTYLHLGNNSISIIPEGLLYNATNLRKLFLQNNHIRKIPHGLFSSTGKLAWLLLTNNDLSDFDLNVFQPLHQLAMLQLGYNNLTLKHAEFPAIPLMELFLDHNNIKEINDVLFRNLHNLRLICLRFNKIKVIKAATFEHPRRLRELRLSDNPIHSFDSSFLTKLTHLNALYLDDTRFRIDDRIVSKLNVSLLSLRGIPRNRIDFKAIAKIENLKHIDFQSYSFCSLTPNFHVKNCFPKSDGISSDADLLSNPTHRFSAWLISIFTCFGNAMVLWGRFTYRDENRSVSMVIRNLAVADFIMGVYLGIIGLQDIRYREKYHFIQTEWIQSWGCTLAGMLAMISSEVSILILTFMSIERFLLISDPFGHHRLNTKNVMICLYVIWLIGISIATFPVILFHATTKFYGLYNGGTCFPLFIREKYVPGWEYSAFVFIGVNLTLLLLIATLYTTLLFSIWRTRRATTLNFFDCEFAIRFFFIVLTDSLCWAPIIISKFLAFTSIEISEDIYAWLVIFVLPFNSAVNPLLYTFSTPKYRDQIYKTFSKQSLTKKPESTSHQVTADDSHAKIISLHCNLSASSASKWSFCSKKS